jgi:hypothetical protein
VFGRHRGEQILHPKTPVDAMTFLERIPEEDLLQKVDHDYDKSFGGVGRREGGGGPSAGHPIFEFRSLSGDFSDLWDTVRKGATAVQTVNQGEVHELL